MFRMTHVTLLLTEIIYCTTIYRSHVALEVKEWAETWQCLVTLGDPTARCWIAEPPFLRTEASLCSKLLNRLRTAPCSHWGCCVIRLAGMRDPRMLA